MTNLVEDISTDITLFDPRVIRLHKNVLEPTCCLLIFGFFLSLKLSYFIIFILIKGDNSSQIVFKTGKPKEKHK